MSTGGWGNGPWGEVPWGDAESITPPDVITSEHVFVSAVNVWAADLIEVEFSVPMKVNATMENPASYNVTPVADGTPVTVLEVRPGRLVVTTRVFLVVSAASLGADYDVAAIGDLRSAYNNIFDTPGTKRTKRIRAYRTKTDSMLAITPAMYDRRVDAIYRTLLNAIGYADNLIGGDIQESDD
jgi:hypothetical protein